MKKLFTLVSAAMLCMQSFAFDYSSNPGSNNYVQQWGKLKLVGNQLSSESGEPIQLRGWSTHGCWFKSCFDDQKDFENMKKEGANLARLAMYINEGCGVDKEWIKNCIDYTASIGMYCLVDWHVLKPGDPTDGSYSGYADFFRDVTSYVKQKGYKHVLWEICNEPNLDQDGAPAKFHRVWDWVKEYAYNVLPIIHSNLPDAVVIVGTPQWDQDVTVAFQDPLDTKDFSSLQIMYSFHHYAGDQQRYLGIFSAATAFVPVFISEWGLSSHTGDSGCDTKAGDHMIQVANGQNLGGQIVSWANWSWADKGETSGTFTGGGYNNLSFSEAGNYIRQQLKKGDNWKKCESTPYESAQVFDGKEDFILDLGAYDKGGQDNAYFDYDEDWACPGNNINNERPCNAGDAGTKDNFRPGEYFDIGYSEKNNPNSYKTLGYIGNGEWITYTIDVKRAGDYDFEVYACDHKDFNTFGIAVDGKPGLVDENGDATEYQALYLQTCNGGDDNGSYNVWGWVKPHNAYKKSINHKLHFETAGEHKLSFAFMTSFSGMGSFKIKGDPNYQSNEDFSSVAAVIAPNPSKDGVFNVTVSENSEIKVVNSLGAVVYSANVEANSTSTINLNAVSGVYFVSVVGETNATTEKLIVK